jgi:hypothetical protein
MTEMMAFCGIDCAQCDAYKATQANDREALERVAAQWREQFAPEITVDDVICDGCTGTDGRLGGYCPQCPVRACAVEHGVETCAHCEDYGCEKVQGFFAHAPELQQAMDALHASLQARD